jgi:orotate phosphoribosyltransferase
MRWLASFPEERNLVLSYMVERLADEVAPVDLDVVAGVATAGISYGAWLADRLAKPFVYVREAAKAHGKGQQVEGRLLPGQRSLVVEDLITTGGSALHTAQTLRDAGARADYCVAIFEYGLPSSQRAFEAAGVKAITLCSIRDLLGAALSTGKISQAEGDIVEEWFAGYSKRAAGG